MGIVFITIIYNNSNLIIFRSLCHIPLDTPRVQFQQQSESEESTNLSVNKVWVLGEEMVLKPGKMTLCKHVTTPGSRTLQIHYMPPHH